MGKPKQQKRVSGTSTHVSVGGKCGENKHVLWGFFENYFDSGK